MPKVVDHEERRRELAAALWRVLRRDGLHAVSVRSVAAEAGWSAGALRHYFTTQQELLAFALELVYDRAGARVRRWMSTATGRDGALDVLREMVPFDDERREEAEVWLAFVARAQSDPGLRALRDEADDTLRRGVRLALQMLVDGGALAGWRHLETEEQRLYALVDGLALHGVTRPDAYPAAVLEDVIERHLDDLAR